MKSDACNAINFTQAGTGSKSGTDWENAADSEKLVNSGEDPSMDVDNSTVTLNGGSFDHNTTYSRAIEIYGDNPNVTLNKPFTIFNNNSTNSGLGQIHISSGTLTSHLGSGLNCGTDSFSDVFADGGTVTCN